MPCGSRRPLIRWMTCPAARSMTSTEPLPSSATNNRLRRRSTAMWSIRPDTFASGMERSRTSGACVFSARAGTARQANAGPARTQATARDDARCMAGALAPGQVDLVQRLAQSGRQFLGIVMGPEVHEEQPGLVIEHVVVQGGDLDAV